MLAELLIIIALVGLFYVLMGALLSLPVAIPSVRARLSHNQKARVVVAAVLSVASLALSSILFARYLAELNFAMETIGYDPWYSTHQKEILASGKQIVEELWLREILPPPLQHGCISGTKTICQYADELTPPNWRRAGESWGSYLGRHFMSVFAFLTTSLLVWRLTRRKPMVRQSGWAG